MPPRGTDRSYSGSQTIKDKNIAQTRKLTPSPRADGDKCRIVTQLPRLTVGGPGTMEDGARAAPRTDRGLLL
ncbi:hypothetical protein EVAR_3037_1 [Eumeta japonica]|uniref:Uncharacterized protein n=1 Tax=Eumeta variegata TaxID=151549 RepID=A0A4C1SWB4_EUMVA|nr:hypothetical protein EVAR_3037_1 [Eumeta japonica]